MLTYKTIYLLIIAALAMAPLSAQNYGEITGTTTDPTGAVVTGATVMVVNTATNVARTLETNETGNYTVPFLVPGIYDVRAEQAGFKVATRVGVELQVGQVARIDFTLEVGEVTETIEVTGAAALLTTASTAVGTVIENRRIVELPLNGRSYTQLIALSPNVTAEQGAGGQANGRQGGERANQAFSIAGQRMQFNRFTLDGHCCPN